jgi:hypothetical protein
MQSRKKSALRFFFLIFLLSSAIFTKAALPKSLPSRKDVLDTFNRSYRQATSKAIAFWDSPFRDLGIQSNPFAISIFYIRYFSRPDIKTADGLFSLNEILTDKKSNVLSSCLALVALMQAQKWDVECFYNPGECYIGLNLSDDWQIRKGAWVEMDGKKYYLKEFDDSTAVGETRIDKPGARYKSLPAKRVDLQPIPVMDKLPLFNPEPSVTRRVEWNYDYADHEINVTIPSAQLAWTKNLPASISGMVHDGFDELRNLGLVSGLRAMSDQGNEFDQVNFLLKFCQSETGFKYVPGLPIRSVTRQIWEGVNDCDGRSVLLCCLLHAVLEYPLENIVFVSWENHLALGVKPRTEKCLETLKAEGKFVSDNFYLLDPSYMGATRWGSKMKTLSNQYEIIKVKSR